MDDVFSAEKNVLDFEKKLTWTTIILDSKKRIDYISGQLKRNKRKQMGKRQTHPKQKRKTLTEK